MWIAVAVVAGAAISAGVSYASSSNAADAQKSAAQTTASAADAATQVQWNEFLQQRADQAPWLKAGTDAVNQLSTGMQPGGRFASTPTPLNYDMAAFKKDPLYQNMMTQQNNILASNRAGAASGGSLGSGNQMVALQALAGNNAETYYQQGFQNNLTSYNANLNAQNTDFNRLSGLAGTGQIAASQIGQAGQNMTNNVTTIGTDAANNIAGTQIAAGNARSASMNNIGNIAGNALTSGVQNYQNYQNQQNLLTAAQNGQTYNPYGTGGYNYTYSDPAAVGPFQTGGR